jgi:RNA polymerase sigma-70 factor (ECF subfamily)
MRIFMKPGTIIPRRPSFLTMKAGMPLGNPDMELDDESLMQQFAAGDGAALSVLVDRHKGALHGFLLRLTRSVHEADEVFQETWMRVIRHADRYRKGQFRGWLFSIARNQVIDRARRARPHESLDQPAYPDGSPETLGDSVAGREPGVFATVAARDLARQARAAVMRLPPEQREVFLLRVEADLTFKEIARIQKVSINTALARMQYALTKLRPMMAPCRETEEI